ncbi:hypothetical protein AGMMS49545_23780 [Betaproteobacteria bacterium]|nr:hypothetical protein AGMMS49545_23780 [Betaproteobacteria bacterium]GHU49252.1 hypothetical protein AGMMS50289_26300 [Betaproteobacteria bacterium]
MLFKMSDVSKIDVIFLMDKCDAKNFLIALNNTRLQGHSSLKITKINKRSASLTETTLHVSLCEEIDEFFYIKGENLKILLSIDAIEYGEYLLSSYIKEKGFPLAEFIEIQTDKFKHKSQLYFYKNE